MDSIFDICGDFLVDEDDDMKNFFSRVSPEEYNQFRRSPALHARDNEIGDYYEYMCRMEKGV